MNKSIYNWRYIYWSILIRVILALVLCTWLLRRLIILLCLTTYHRWRHCAVSHCHSIIMCIWIVVCIITHRFLETSLNSINMLIQINTCFFYKLPGFNFSIWLNFKFYQIKQRMRSPISSKSYTFVSQKLLTNNISKCMIFLVHSDCCKVTNLHALLIQNPLFSFLYIKVSFEHVFVDKFHF